MFPFFSYRCYKSADEEAYLGGNGATPPSGVTYKFSPEGSNNQPPASSTWYTITSISSACEGQDTDWVSSADPSSVITVN